jgi:Domain of unknown function (DUF4440)
VGCARSRPAVLPAAEAAPLSTVEESELRLQRATVLGDRATGASLLPATYAFITSTGTAIDKETTLSGLDGFGSAFEDMKIVDVNTAGRSAIVTFTVVIVRAVGQGQQSVQRARVVRLWKLGADRIWRAEFEQRTPILL